MYGYVYETTCCITNKKYIGQHRYSDFPNIDKKYFGSGKLILKAIEKYGIQNFTCEILEWCETKESLCEREKYYINKYNAVLDENYYNLTDKPIGQHLSVPWNKGKHGVQEWTPKMEEAFEKGRRLPASKKQKETASRVISNSVWINNGLERKRINKHDDNLLESYLSNGWVLGWKIN